MRFLTICALVFGFVSCQQEKEDDVIDMRDVIPQSTPMDSKKTVISKPDTLGSYIDTSILSKLKLNVSSIRNIDMDLTPERLSPTSSCMYKMRYKSDSLIYLHWSYRDSIFTKNAFYNWLDCFGKKCKSVRLGESTMMQREGFLLFISDTSITYLSSQQPLKKEDWIAYFEGFSNRKDWRMVVEQKNNAKAKWYQVKESQFTPILFK